MSGSMAYLRTVLMLKALSFSIESVWSSLLASSAMEMAASSARLIICLSGWDFISICVVVCVLGFTMDAPSVGLPVTMDSSVYMKFIGFHAARYECICGGSVVRGVEGMEGYVSL